MEASVIKRVFLFNGTRLADPNPNANVDAVRDSLSSAHPELATAAIDGPVVKGDTHEYTFVKSVGTKG